MSQTFTAYIEFDQETGLYAGTIPGLPGGHSQGESLDELQRNLKEVVELILEERKAHGEVVHIEPFVGIQQITVEA
ncbi:MAG TPA: type II toxin-antitoxin system HicB family antitoxin [Pirellulales bacterium]